MRISELSAHELSIAKKKYRDYVYNRRGRRCVTTKDFETWYYDYVNLGKQPWITTKSRQPNWYSKLRFQRHRAQAKFRNIEFEFTWEQWHQWWLDHGIDRNQPNPERGRDRLCMCRYGDAGPYNLNNVYLATHSENAHDAAVNGRHSGGRPAGSKNKPKMEPVQKP